MRKYITKPQAIRILEEIVAEGGRDKTVLNRYTHPEDRTKPECIVGHFFYRMDPAILANIENLGLNYAGPEVLVERGVAEGWKITRPALELLNKVQTVQDGRDYHPETGTPNTDRTWGNALAVATKA